MKELLKKLFQNDTIFDYIFQSPETILPVTFLILCLMGSLFLVLPQSGDLTYLDALFTSVSGVCVTGLSVADISEELTSFGQMILMILIQLGGLGIMTVSSIIIILLGKRMSVRYERNARSMFDVESKNDIKNSLLLILKYTALFEFAGMLILFFRFYSLGETVLGAIKQSMFLAVSAFCNAGFALSPDNLISYNLDPVILYTVSFLIISGGIAPVIAILFPQYLKYEKINPTATMVFNTTIFLLVFGTIIFLIAEYNGVLAGMNLADKIHNSWFQSVTARTAGFSSVDMNSLNGISYILLIFLMIIGGSPGGTAGGIKTTVFAIIMLTFYNTLKGKPNIIRNKNITQALLHKSITLVASYLILISIIIFMLITTQKIGAQKIVFEVVSAMGTVGLSMDATTLLNNFGKIVIIITMFLGRVFPAVLIYHLNSYSSDYRLRYPDAKISLT